MHRGEWIPDKMAFLWTTTKLVHKRHCLFQIPRHSCKSHRIWTLVCLAKKKASQTPQEVDVFGAAGLSQEELLKQALENNQHPKESKKKESKSTKEETNHKKVVSRQKEPMEEEVLETNATEQRQKEEVVQDPEARKEYEKFLSEVEPFTWSGRQKKKNPNRISKGDVDGYRHAQGVSWIRLQDISMYFGGVKLLNHVTWEVKSGDRIGLVGDNGSGKTTMLKILAGLITPESGEIIKSSPRVRTAFLRQEFIDELCPTRTLKEELLSVFEKENQVLQEYQQLEDKIANMGTDGDNLEYMEELLNQLENYREQCEDNDVWNLDTRVERLLPQLGFLPEDAAKPISSFSGGWKVRIGLGKVLLKKPDILLLDEPTNHLDIESLEWLEEYLSSCNIGLVIVSHDREFLDRVTNRIVEVENGETHEFVGNYTSYLRQKQDLRAAWEAAYQRQQKFLEEQYSFIRRFQSSATRASQVKSREKLLQNMQLKGQLVPRPPKPGKPLVLRFPSASRSGNDVVEFRNVTHGYGDRTLFRNVNLLVERGDRLAIVGPNGSGKSTLLKLIVGQEKPNQGEVILTSHNLVVGYFEQSQADVLPLDKTVYETIEHAAGTSKSYEEIRALLGRFLFKGDSVYKSVASLSGGEKARLALCKILVTPVNLLVLDEPTNHIDIGAKETLEEALQLYDGTLILVSHDRYFVSRVAKQILSIENEQVVFYNGDYRYYLDRNEDFKERLERRFIQGVTEIKSAPEVGITDQVLSNVEKRKKAFGGSNVAAGKKKLYDTKRWK